MYATLTNDFWSISLASRSQICESTAKTCALWQSVGFTHGVLNTDNMSILGLTIDYGPYGFQEYFDWDHVPNGSDGTGRYDYKSQPEMCRWNCGKLAEAFGFCGVLNAEEGKNVVEDAYDLAFDAAYMEKMRAKLGEFHGWVGVLCHLGSNPNTAHRAARGGRRRC